MDEAGKCRKAVSGSTYGIDRASASASVLFVLVWNNKQPSLPAAVDHRASSRRLQSHRRQLAVARPLRESRLEKREAAKREEGHIGDAAARQFIDQRVVVAMHEIVMVLQADDLGDAVCLLELAGGHVAQAELSDQALPLELGQGRKLFLDRALVRLENAADAQVDHVERVNPEVAEVVVDGGAREVCRGERGNPRCVPPRTVPTLVTITRSLA